ncbi:hypothetical protein CEP53_008085 [Fusarium sp. AF-6]|nr:hypothetical protein CEP53_008085 [Fusarium sp. AF-6]
MERPSSQSPSQNTLLPATDLENGTAASVPRATTPPTTEDIELSRKDTSSVAQDGDIVDLDGPDDSENPMGWPDSKKWLNIILISILTLVTPLGSSMFAPGIPRIMVEFNETSPLVATLVVSIYVLGFAFGPLVVAPLSEVYGRAPLYNWGNVLFVLFTVGTALSQNMPMMMAFRFLMGFAGSVPITIGSGSIADMMPIESRGKAMSVWALGPLLGPCIGPLAGGYFIKAAGWRWVYWLVTIMGGIFIPGSFLFVKETYAPVLLERKAHRLRKETENTKLRARGDKGEPLDVKFKLAIVRPLKPLFITPIVGLMALYMAVA